MTLGVGLGPVVDRFEALGLKGNMDSVLKLLNENDALEAEFIAAVQKGDQEAIREITRRKVALDERGLEAMGDLMKHPMLKEMLKGKRK